MMDHDAPGHSLISKIWKIKQWPEKGVGVATFDAMLERLMLRDCIPSRVLIYTMALSGRVISSSKLIHKRLWGTIPVGML
jgi:hypothetical protein